MHPAIETRGLSKRFGRHLALDAIELSIAPGEVFGYLGPNGAGKTTTIRILAGLLRPSAGNASVLGRDVVRERDVMQARLGYLPGNFVGYPDLSGEQYLRFLANLRGQVDWQGVVSMAKRLDLDLGRRLSVLSHGNRQKVGIVQALMHQPEVVILDEPTTGLDPIIQREFLGLLRDVRDTGGTVFLSSHILSEVEAIADHVGIIRDGSLVVVESVERLKHRAVRRMDLTFAGEPPQGVLSAIAGVRELTISGSTAHLAVEGSTAELLAAAAPHRVEQIVTHEPDLEEIFLGYYERRE
jgi:ABC-2 type transport system ATP-binding protein